MGPAKHGERGDINGFSAESRRRLMERLIRLDWARQPVHFITLTYPGTYTKDPRVWKDNLNAFRSALGRRYRNPPLWAFWRLEFQKRGAPHYHIVANAGVGSDLADLRDDVRETWSRIVGLSAIAGEFARVDVQRAILGPDNGYGKLMTYLCKYVGKRQSLRTHVETETGEIPAIGRFWGLWGKPPLKAPARLDLTAHDYLVFVRRIRRRYRKDPFLCKVNVGWHSWLGYIPDSAMRQLLRGLGDDRYY